MSNAKNSHPDGYWNPFFNLKFRTGSKIVAIEKGAVLTFQIG
jgi:hypothetical protein